MRLARLLRAGGHHAHDGAHKSAEYGGFHAPHVNPLHRNIGVTLGAIMWFWIFYRAREDGPVVLGWRHPWDHAGHDDHGDGHGDGHGDADAAHGGGHGDDHGDAAHGKKEAQLH